MANDNAQGAYTFDPLAGKPPAHHEVWNVHDGPSEPGLDATTPVNFDAIHGMPLPHDKGHDTYVNMPGDGITPG